MTESEGWSFNPTDIRKGFYRFSNMGVAGVMKEVKLWCSKCHFRFFTTVANDEPGHLPTPFDITPFSFTPTMTARLHKRDWVPFAISTSPVIHNTPCLPHTILRKNQGTCSHYKTHNVNTPLPYSLWWSGTSKKSGLIQEMKRTIFPPRRRMFLDYKLVPDRSRE